MEKFLKTSIISRFGLLGFLLFNHYSQKNRWQDKYFIFSRFTIGFFLVFLGPGLIIGISLKHSWLGIFFLTILSTVYGWWAETFFNKFTQKREKN
ncbi:hypothetical protein [Enterococcus massiliensis]|uniref:hypothetical protein n=1 Tax=Enterococcus massiliensis TaxID=1640685 RepID=UPI00065E44A0|nr:hypothetical protein [Enterococcus massiliensis]